jgi:hypothetical protein
MNQCEISKWVDVLSKGVAIPGGLVAVFMAIHQWRQNRILRERDLRWKQATAAKQLIDEMLDDKWAKDATRMLDNSQRKYMVNEKSTAITEQDVINSLEMADKGSSEKTQYIWDCFDFFLYYVELMEQSINNGLFKFGDVEFPLGYYARKLRETEINAAMLAYMKRFEYKNSIAFFKRFGLFDGYKDG